MSVATAPRTTTRPSRARIAPTPRAQSAPTWKTMNPTVMASARSASRGLIVVMGSSLHLRRGGTSLCLGQGWRRSGGYRYDVGANAENRRRFDHGRLAEATQEPAFRDREAEGAACGRVR